jgi:hypothetical protein
LFALYNFGTVDTLRKVIAQAEKVLVKGLEMRFNIHRIAIVALALSLVIETAAAQMLMWTQLTPTGTPPAGDGGNGMVFDAATDQLIAFGAGNGDNNSVWTLSLGASPQEQALNGHS